MEIYIVCLLTKNRGFDFNNQSLFTELNRAETEASYRNENDPLLGEHEEWVVYDCCPDSINELSERTGDYCIPIDNEESSGELGKIMPKGDFIDACKRWIADKWRRIWYGCKRE